MPECLNCGAFVTETYVRVNEPEEYDNARVCPECPDKIRGKGNQPRKARSTRRGDGGDEVDFDRDEDTKDKDNVSKSMAP